MRKMQMVRAVGRRARSGDVTPWVDLNGLLYSFLATGTYRLEGQRRYRDYVLHQEPQFWNARFE